MSSSGPASTRLINTSDILSHIFSYLSTPSDLFATLQVNETFYQLCLPLLYNTIIIKSGSKIPLSNIGNLASPKTGVRSGNESNPSATMDQNVSPIPLYHTDVLGISIHNLVKKITVNPHHKSDCQFFINSHLPILPNLELIDIDIDSILEFNRDNCNFDNCPFISNICLTAKRAIIHELNLVPLKNMSKLKEVVLKIRPCQIPYLEGMTKDSSRTLQENLRLPILVENLKIVFWDEKHSFKINYNSKNLTYSGDGYYTFEGKKMRIRNCIHCDGPGCIIRPFGVPWSLPELMKLISIGNQNNNNLKVVDISNIDKLVEFGRHDGEDDPTRKVKKLQNKMIQGFKKGEKVEKRSRNENTDTSHSIHHTGYQDQVNKLGDLLNDQMKFSINTTDNNNDTIEKETGVKVSFFSFQDYYPTYRILHNINNEESEYWKMRISPSAKILRLHQRVKEENTLESHKYLSTFSIDLMSAEGLEDWLIQEERWKERRKRQEEATKYWAENKDKYVRPKKRSERLKNSE